MKYEKKGEDYKFLLTVAWKRMQNIIKLLLEWKYFSEVE